MDATEGGGSNSGKHCDVMKPGPGFIPTAAYHHGGGGSWTSQSGVWGQPSFYGHNNLGGTMMMQPGGGGIMYMMGAPGGMRGGGGGATTAYDMESSFYWLERYAERNGLSLHPPPPPQHQRKEMNHHSGEAGDLIYKPPVPSWNQHVGSGDVTDEKTPPV